jgi:hypothetical protein
MSAGTTPAGLGTPSSEHRPVFVALVGVDLSNDVEESRCERLFAPFFYLNEDE